MKKFVLNLIKTLLGFSIAYVICLPIFYRSPINGHLMFRRGGYGHMYSRLEELDKLDKQDLLFLGSSHTYRNFDTQFFKSNGLTSFNLGSSSQSPDVTGILISEYLSELSPKLVIYEVYPEIIFSQRLESRIDVFSNLRISRFPSVMNFTTSSIGEFNTMILSFWHQIVNSEFKEDRYKGQDTYIDGGYVRNEEIRTQFDLSIKSLSIDLENAGFENLRQNVEYIQEFGAQIVLVYAPLPSDTYSLYKAQNNTIDSLYSSLGFPYINYNGIPLNDTLHFKDDDHLNHAGVQIFNQRLLKDLDSLSVLDVDIH